MAAVETLTEVIGGRGHNLFGTTPEEVQQAFSNLSTTKQFSVFAKNFFGRFTKKCLDYFLSKTMSHHLGESQRFSTLAGQGAFTKAMETHCKEAAKIVETYSGGWFSKKNWETGGEITRKDVRDFTSYAMTKLTSELKEGAAADGK